jgi:FtsZ-interacting cell division protein ZipA
MNDQNSNETLSIVLVAIVLLALIFIAFFVSRKPTNIINPVREINNITTNNTKEVIEKVITKEQTTEATKSVK